MSVLVKSLEHRRGALLLQGGQHHPGTAAADHLRGRAGHDTPYRPTLRVGTPTASSVPLSWTGSTDDVGIAGYRVYRDGGTTPIASPVTTTFSDTGLSPGTTHQYVVKAVDAAGNTSTASNLVTATTAAASTAPLTFGPTDDATVDASLPATNFGSATRVTVDGSPLTSSLLKFNVTGTAGCLISSAKLRLTVGATANDNSAYGGDLYGTSSNWSQSTVTWNNAPAAGSSKISSVATAVSLNTSYLFDVKPLVVGDGLVSVLVKSPSTDGARYFSKEGSTTRAPQLQITCGGGTTPLVGVGSASGVTTTGATLTATADGHGLPTTCSFDYGTSQRYGSQTLPQSLPGGTGATSFTATVTGLSPGTPFNFRAQCTNSSATAYGSNATFATSVMPGVNNVTKTLVIVEENHGYAQMRAEMPYLADLSRQYGYATDYQALAHPSLPNYLAMAGGSMFGVTATCAVSDCPVASSPTVFDQAIAAGKTAKVYAEDMTANCQVSGAGAGLYAVRHTAWPYFTDPVSRANCNANQVPSGTYAAGNFKDDVTTGNLPNIGWLIPNLCNDAHDPGCTLARADNWLADVLPVVFASPDWQSGHLAVVVTADEDSGVGGNNVLTVVMHPGLAGAVVTTPLNHYSLARFQEQVAGVQPYLNEAATAPDLPSAFGLVVGP